MSDVTAPVARQFEAYNRRDLDGFVACFAEDFRSYRMPAETPSLQGRTALAAFYAEHRFNNPALRAELISRTVVGNTVFDHERIHGLGDRAVENMAVFEIRDGLIAVAWFFVADAG
ncbi:nuclear transport factor 2 family protein [Xanthomonas sp. XNM01]|uniref:nuclear transport factor 2 family protein n=1 Tax=Xanthomonas sp. XNM01 TaxID=2769289 RepID=UPI00177ADC50|nr:nuclear transport factor 2 family protein [Xanthomonas sp. XNM01]MBD9369051.1 nuclear transport factor 2 family protein [Xanthomonas sp. XNM01]